MGSADFQKKWKYGYLGRILVKYKNKFAKFPKKSVTFCGFDGTYIQQLVMENKDRVSEVRERRPGEKDEKE